MVAMACDTWPVDPSCLPTGWASDPADWDPEQTQAVEVASDILRRLTAGAYGLCRIKVRPCRTRCLDAHRNSYFGVAAMGSLPYQPMLIDGRVYNVGCGCTGSCGCGPLPEIILEPFAHDIVQVRVDGVIVPPLSYRIDDNRRLVRTDGGVWPDCQELVRPDTEPGTFSVLYRTGVPVPPGGRMAVTALAVELVKACKPKSGCALPERENLLEYLELFGRGRTGLTRVDLWVASVNPYGARAPMRVYSPDTVRSRRETGGAFYVDPVPGAPGTGYFHWFQDIAATSITIDHDLGYRPSGVELYSADWATRYVTFGLIHIDENRVNIVTDNPFRGHVILG